MKLFSWFKQGSKDSNKWEEQREEKSYVRQKEKEVRRSKLDDIKRYNKNKEDRLKV